ncbi:MAG: hypothetical protein VKP72_13280 [bacterium]|nr:hypothetical protein [bacterium]
MKKSWFVDAGYDVEVVSPEGGKLAFDTYSDPEHESGYSAHDSISLGFKHSPRHMALLENTRRLSDSQTEFEPVWVVVTRRVNPGWSRSRRRGAA